MQDVHKARERAHMKLVSFAGIKGESMFGLDHPAAIFCMEQLPGAKHMKTYPFRFNKEIQYEAHPEAELEEASEQGAMRCVPFESTSRKNTLSFLSNPHRKMPKMLEEINNGNYRPPQKK